MKKLYRENKVLFILLIIIAICLAFICVGIISYFYSGDKDKYGDRLRNKEQYKISDNIENTIMESIDVNTIDVDVRGKIIYISIDVKNGNGLVNVQSYALKALESFTDEEKSYYDIQFIFTCKDEELGEEEKSLFPIEGYKSSISNQVSWVSN